MNRFVKNSLSKTEIRAYLNAVFAIRKIGPLKFWVEINDPDEDIRRAKIVGLARVKALEVVKIKIPTIGYKGAYTVSPEVVLPQLDRSKFPGINAYSVEIGKPYCEYDPTMSYVDPSYYNAEVTLYRATIIPPKLTLKEYDLPTKTL